MNLPAMVKLPNGRTIACDAEDFSEGGLAIKLPVEIPIDIESQVRISLFRGEREFTFPAVVVFNKGLVFRVRFENLSLTDYRAFVAATFSRGDAWQGWLPERDVDRPLKGLREVLGVGITGIGRFIRRFAVIDQLRNLVLWKK